MVVVYHGVLPYERSRHVALMEAYARHVEVVYVDPDASGRNTGEHAENERLTHVTMGRSLPGGRYSVIGALNRWLGLRRLLRDLRRRKKQPVVLVSQQPGLLPTVRGLSADVTVYEVRDDVAGLVLGERKARRLARAHLRMLRECDVIWAVSRTLAEDIRAIRPDVFRTDQGVDCDAFEAASQARVEGELAAVPRPRVGLVGNLNDRIDWELLETLARARPDWQITLVGPVYHPGPATEQAIERLRGIGNVHLLGPVEPDALPAAIAALDVGLIPYRLDTAANMRINPLKLYQYLAAGVPVVATEIPAISELKGAARIAHSSDEFVDAIEVSLSSLDDAGARSERRRMARVFDWKVIADRQLDILRHCLAQSR